MKTRTSLIVLLMLVGTFALAADKYISADFGFAASFPGDVVRTQVRSDAATFLANAQGGAWSVQVKVDKNVAMPNPVTRGFMEAKLAEVLKAGGMVQTGASSYTTFEGHPALFATATFFKNDIGTNFITYPIAVDIRLIFVNGRSLIKGQNRVYSLAGMAIQGKDRSGIQLFLDSFELREP